MPLVAKLANPVPQALEDLYTHYDGTVRNAAGGIVQVGTGRGALPSTQQPAAHRCGCAAQTKLQQQAASSHLDPLSWLLGLAERSRAPRCLLLPPRLQLRYGEDGMDPGVMEGKGGEPVMFNRVLSVRQGWGPARAACEGGRARGGRSRHARGGVRAGDAVCGLSCPRLLGEEYLRSERAFCCWSCTHSWPCLLAVRIQVVKASQPRLPRSTAAPAAGVPAAGPAGGAQGPAPPPAGPMDVDSPPAAGKSRRRGGKKGAAGSLPTSPIAAGVAGGGSLPMSPRSQPMSPVSPSAADAAAAALAAAADHSGGRGGTLGRELVPLPDQLQQAVDAAMASGACCVRAKGVPAPEAWRRCG